MPELPEVEVVRRGLAAVLIGRTIAAVEVIGPLGARTVRRHLAGPGDFAAALSGRTVTDIRRRGKYLWWVLDDEDAVLAHLGMSGQFRIADPPPAAGHGDATAVHPHTRLRVHLSGDGRVVDFLDQRTFGGMMVVPGGAELPPPIAHIARDLLDPRFDPAGTVHRIRARSSGIKRVLLDQTVISGIGNIYADEALWAARVHYDRRASSLAARTVHALLASARDVMLGALAEGGTSFDALYVNVNGESGYFSRELHSYGREGLPCHRCGAPIRREAFMNRSSYFCPKCQPRPRVRPSR